MIMIDRIYGGIYGWCYCKHIDEWMYCLLYWPIVAVKELRSQIRRLKRVGFWAGFMDRSRGLHFDNKLLRGRWY